MKKKICLLLSILLLSGNAAYAADESNDISHFQRVNTYHDGQFTDVLPEDWYGEGVGVAYELGLMQGEAEDYFDAAGLITVEQAVVMAARLHSIYATGSGEFPPGEYWSEPYIDYALEQGILSSCADLYTLATRARFADILSRSLPEEALEPVNEVVDNAIPDVRMRVRYADSIYALYRAGVVTGDEEGKFHPQNTISRAEAAVILTRMADKTLRQSITLREPRDFTPDLTAGNWMDDSFFANSAILGNSLVNGLQMYSELKSLHYFSANSVSVVSATNTKDTQLSDGSKGTLVEALCQGQYDRIYLALGINEIYFNVDRFIELYGGMVDTIRAAQPHGEIYILSLLPVTKQKSDSHATRNMTRIKRYNEALHTLAVEKECYYMDLCSAFQGEDGYLPADWSSDGVHPYRKYYSIWESCMRTMYR